MPKISVIIPLYNKETTIKKTIESVLNQTYTDFEIIVVNDGSTDRSLEIVRSVKDSRIRIIDQENEGVSATRNRGAKDANSDLIFFLDADDLILPDCLEALYELSRLYQNANLWSGCFKSVFQGKEHDEVQYKQIGYVDKPSQLLWNMKWGFRIGSYLITKSSFIEAGMFPTQITIGEDMWFTLNYISKYQCAHTNKVLMCYVKDSRTLSKRRVNIEKTCEWYATLNNTDKYVNRKFASLIGTSIIRYIMRLDSHSCRLLAGKFNSNFFYIMLWTIVYNVKKYTRNTPACCTSNYGYDGEKICKQKEW